MNEVGVVQTQILIKGNLHITVKNTASAKLTLKIAARPTQLSKSMPSPSKVDRDYFSEYRGTHHHKLAQKRSHESFIHTQT